MIDSDFVQIVADGLGIKPTLDAANTLAPDVEYRLREIIQEASKFARHSKRTYITPDDVNQAFKLRNVEPIYGLSNASDPSRFVRAAGNLDIVYAEDPVVPLSTILDAPLPAVPWEAGFAIHWLAVNGKQPRIPENAPLIPPTHRDKRQKTEAARHVPAPLVPPPPPQQQSNAAVVATQVGTTTTTNNTTTADEGSLVRAPLKHVVSKELHLYYQKITATLQTCAPPPSPSSRELIAVLTSLRKDAGLQPLAPYLAHFIADSVATNLISPPRLHIILRAAISLGSNPSLDLGPYLHEIIPAVLTCLLGKSIGFVPSSSSEIKNKNGGNDKKRSRVNEAGSEGHTPPQLNSDALHWTVREQAAKALSALRSSYPDAAPRVQRQLLDALVSASQQHQMPTLYGAVVGIEAQGPRAVRALLLPNLIPVVDSMSDDLSGVNGRLRMAASLKVRAALLSAVGHCVYLSGLCEPWTHGVGTAMQQQQQQQFYLNTSRGKDDVRNTLLDKKIAKTTKRQRLALHLSVEEAAKMHHHKMDDQNKQTVKTTGGRRRGGGSKKESRRDMAPQTYTMHDVFGEEAEEEEQGVGDQMDEEMRLFAEWQQKNRSFLTDPVKMRPVTPDNANMYILSFDSDAAEYKEEQQQPKQLGQIRSTNYLVDAWKEDFPVADIRKAMIELFGEDVEPYERRKKLFECYDDCDV